MSIIVAVFLGLTIAPKKYSAQEYPQEERF